MRKKQEIDSAQSFKLLKSTALPIRKEIAGFQFRNTGMKKARIKRQQIKYSPKEQHGLNVLETKIGFN